MGETETETDRETKDTLLKSYNARRTSIVSYQARRDKGTLYPWCLCSRRLSSDAVTSSCHVGGVGSAGAFSQRWGFRG